MMRIKVAIKQYTKSFPFFAACLLISALVTNIAAVIPPYTDADRTGHQNAILDDYRTTKLNFGVNCPAISVLSAQKQVKAEISELEMKARGGNPGITEAQLDAHMHSNANKLTVVVDNATNWVDSGLNRKFVYYWAHLTAYTFHRYSNVAWASNTLDTTLAVFHNTNWLLPPWYMYFTDILGDERAGLLGMRLLGGEFFNDEILLSRARKSFYNSRDNIAGGGSEFMQPHYSAAIIRNLVMMYQVRDPILKKIAKDMLEGEKSIYLVMMGPGFPGSAP